MAASAKSAEDYRYEFLVVAEHFDRAATTCATYVRSGGLVLSENYRGFQKGFEQLLDQAGTLLIGAAQNGLVNNDRLKKVVTSFKPRGPALLQLPANVFTLYVGGERIELRGRPATHVFREIPDSEPISYEESWPSENITYIAAAAIRNQGFLTITETHCRGYAAACRELAKNVGVMAEPKKGKRVVGAEKVPAGTDRRSWTQPEVDEAIRRYRDENGQRYAELREAIEVESKAASKAAIKATIKTARKLFGRNYIAQEILDCPEGMVSKSRPWVAIRDELHLGKEKGRQTRGQREGMEIALERAAESQGEPTFDQVSRNEVVEQIRGQIPGAVGEAIIEQLLRGDITDDVARNLAKEYREQHPGKRR